ncbi:alpha-L-rhamnosidase-related protein [Pararhodonellum marinum]|uniref:alpha-L-rhamnosidase-related protein n=1 Tax=Pararhodonellum marinum TaxID=2755358 RepID=UPI00189078A9|nr:glycogen debranching protein [Pararhodonellum marinum]
MKISGKTSGTCIFFKLLSLLLINLWTGCSSNLPSNQSLQNELEGVPLLQGKSAYLASPFVTAGDRVYMVGHQDGSFPDLGWHVEGEMGGIWNHPIKLMDGFTAAIGYDGASFCLDQATGFTNYPFANKHLFGESLQGLEVERFQFVPEGKQGLIIEFLFTNLESQNKTFGFEFAGHTDLMPVWLGERSGMIDHPDTLSFDESRQAWVGKDLGNEWYVIFGSDQRAKKTSGPSESCDYQPQGKGKAARLGYEVNLGPNEKSVLRFFISGSYQSLADAQETFDELKEDPVGLLINKKDHYANIASYSRISIPDKELEEAFEWVKYNTEWLVRDVPEIGRGLGAGMPDYPWWFGVDNEYTLKGAIATGRKDLVYETIALIHQLSESNENGKIVHEVSTNGVVFNPGNINETPQFASLIWWVYAWTGDLPFLEKYFPTIEKGLDWLMDEKDLDGNLFPDGYGMMEIHGLESEMIDVAVYTQKAFADASKMAALLGKNELADAYKETGDVLKDKINEEFWVEEYNSYADFIGTTQEALELIDAAIIRSDTLQKPWAVEELKATQKKLRDYPMDQKQGFVLFHNWVVNTPMEMGIADKDKGIKALDKGSRFVNPFGVFVTGIDRDESSESDDGSFAGSKVFSYTGAVMTLPTGVQAIAENNYGRPDKALDYLQRMTRSFSYALPGSIYEVSPDYGMMAQAWNLYSYAVPIVTQFFGIQPDAGSKTIFLNPQLPSSWNEASIERVLIGENEINLNLRRVNDRLEVNIQQTSSDWRVIFLVEDNKSFRILLNGEKTNPEAVGDQIGVVFSGSNNTLTIDQ